MRITKIRITYSEGLVFVQSNAKADWKTNNDKAKYEGIRMNNVK